MTLNELVEYVKADLTASCALPFAPPDNEIKRIIDLETRYLKQYYRSATESAVYFINPSVFTSKEFKATKTIQLPDCVLGIELLHEANQGNSLFGMGDAGLSMDRTIANEMYLSSMGSSDMVAYRTIQLSMYNLYQTFNLRDVQHNFNINTKKLIILGRTPIQGMYLRTINSIADESLFEDPIVIKWIIAKSKISLARILGTFDYSLIGNVRINYNDIKSEGNDEISKLEDIIKNDYQSDWFMMVT